jgi:hypothetical protein
MHTGKSLPALAVASLLATTPLASAQDKQMSTDEILRELIHTDADVRDQRIIHQFYQSTRADEESCERRPIPPPGTLARKAQASACRREFDGLRAQATEPYSAAMKFMLFIILSSEGHLNLCEGKCDLNAAIKVFQEAVDLDPDNPGAK